MKMEIELTEKEYKDLQSAILHYEMESEEQYNFWNNEAKTEEQEEIKNRYERRIKNMEKLFSQFHKAKEVVE